MLHRAAFMVTDLNILWRTVWEIQSKAIVHQWNAVRKDIEQFKNTFIYIEDYDSLQTYFRVEDGCSLQVIRRRRDKSPAAVIVRKPGAPAELWCHAKYKNYRDAFAEFVRIEEKLEVRPRVPDIFDIDHAFFWRGVLAWGGRYVRVVIVPWETNSTWGWTYEATLLKQQPWRLAVRRPIS